MFKNIDFIVMNVVLKILLKVILIDYNVRNIINYAFLFIIHIFYSNIRMYDIISCTIYEYVIITAIILANINRNLIKFKTVQIVQNKIHYVAHKNNRCVLYFKLKRNLFSM